MKIVLAHSMNNLGECNLFVTSICVDMLSSGRVGVGLFTCSCRAGSLFSSNTGNLLDH